jgi:predicted nucleotidyltransferase
MELSMSEKSKPLQPTLEEILQTLQGYLPELKQKYGVKSLGVFGSYVRGENKPRSDLDLLVEFEQAPTLFEFVRLERHLAEIVGVKVDLVMKSALKPEIGKNILAELVPV